LRILPLAFSGIASMTVTTAGTLKAASRSRQNPRSDSSSITEPSEAVTKATTISPQCSSGWPTTATAVTPG
jgi:hypothetical protein